MLKNCSRLFASAFVAMTLAAAPARAQIPDRVLLSTFCDAAAIKGSSCQRAKNYPDAGRRGCDVTLGPSRNSGRFIASGNPLLVVAYESACEAHVTDFGGAVVFEDIAGKMTFRAFLPGAVTRDCVTLAKDAAQDVLVCLSGHTGQGLMETGVALMAFTRDFDKRISIAPDYLLTAEDSNGAYGANVVTCKDTSKYFEISKLSIGPRPGTVMVEVSLADSDTIHTACTKGFPKPAETFGELTPGDAYVPSGNEKHRTLTIDIATRAVF